MMIYMRLAEEGPYDRAWAALAQAERNLGGKAGCPCGPDCRCMDCPADCLGQSMRAAGKVSRYGDAPLSATAGQAITVIEFEGGWQT